MATPFFPSLIYEIHMPEQVRFYGFKPDKIIVLTNYIKKELVAAGFIENNILISPDGVDIEKFDLKTTKGEARNMVGLPLNKKIILYSGSFYMYGWKGIDVLLDAAGFLGDDCLIVLLGGKENEIAEIKNKYELNNIFLIKQKPHAEVPYYLRSADVLVLPNKKGDEISEKYTSPLKLFEYMASGTPIVASDLPSIREVLNKNNYILVESDNSKDLAQSIKEAMRDRDLADRISKQALGDVQNYTWEKRAEGIVKFISQ